MVERSDFNAFRDGHIPEVQILLWGIGSQQNGLGRVLFLHLTETKLMKRLSPGLIRGGSNLRKHEDVSLGKEHIDTLRSKYWLVITLHEQ